MSKEKKRPEVLAPAAPDAGGSMFDVQPDAENKNVTVQSGPYCEELPVAGMSVGEVRKRFADKLDIAKQSASIVSGSPVDENYTLKVGEQLSFIHQAGEKGVQTITIEGDWAIAKSPEGQTKKMEVAKMMQRATPRMDTGPCILPDGVKAVMSRGPITLWFWEKAPSVQNLKWIAADSPGHYGTRDGTRATYRKVRIALPYLIIIAAFSMGPDGMPNGLGQNECFFRNEPLKSINDELCFPALLNCSKWSDEAESHALSWICTQHLKPNPLMHSENPGDRFIGGFEAVRYCLLETGFNRSSENHEGNSWFKYSAVDQKIDPRIATVERWEAETKKDPLFAVEVPWIKSHRSVKDMAERCFRRFRAPDQSVKTSNDLYRVIFNG
jgi:hypothetical protein